MLLGLVSFGLFIVRFSVADLDPTLEHSFEFAHLVMFFVGVLLVAQTAWTCFTNGFSKKQVGGACSLRRNKR